MKKLVECCTKSAYSCPQELRVVNLRGKRKKRNGKMSQMLHREKPLGNLSLSLEEGCYPGSVVSAMFMQRLYSFISVLSLGQMDHSPLMLVHTHPTDSDKGTDMSEELPKESCLFFPSVY